MEISLQDAWSTREVYIASVLIFALVIFAESVAPRRHQEGPLLWRWSNNFALALITWYGAVVLGTWFLVELTRLTAVQRFGLLRHAQLGPLPKFLILLTLTQLLNYWLHRAMHRFRWLWCLHGVHHADTQFDVSTSYRHHPLEPLVFLPLLSPLVLLLGVSAEAIVIYRIFDVAANVFSHSNVRLPLWLERPLSRVILTPDFHRVHHCSDETYTNSNFGVLVPWFDYLFGTARVRNFDEHETMEIGLEYLRDARESRVDRQLLMPVRILHRAPAQFDNATGVISNATRVRS